MKPILLATALLAALPVQAADYARVLPDQSSLRFAYQQMGVRMEGRFKGFSAQLSFDPARPEAARARFDVPLAGIDTGSGEADQEVAGKAWFHSAAFPVAQFVSEQVRPLGGQRYEVSGRLTIKGQTRPLVIPATVSVQGNTAVFEGGFTLRRGDFAIGEGSWSKFDIVANDVQVQFRVAARSQ